MTTNAETRPRAALALITLIYAFNFMDRQVLSVLAEPIKHDLQLSDTQLGLLNGFMFAIFYTTFGVPIAWLADRHRRVSILATACTIWSLCTAACGLTASFAQIALARIGVGLGEAGGVPPSYSIISDLFPIEKRARAIAIFSLGVPFGLALGSALAGWTSSLFGWRVSMFVVGLPGLLLALLLILTVKEPRRGRYDDNPDGEQPTLWTCIRTFYGTPTIALPAVSCAIGAIVNFGIMSWQSAYLIRVLGMRLDQIGTYLSITIVVAMSAGNLISGALLDRYRERDARAYVLIPAGAFALAIPFFVAGLYATTWQTALPLLGISLGCCCAYLPPAITLTQNAMPSRQRATGGALLLFVVNLLGLGGGPVYVGMISDWASATHGVAGLRIGLYALLPFFGIAIIGYLVSAHLIGKQGRIGNQGRRMDFPSIATGIETGAA